MDDMPDIAAVGALIGQPARARMLYELLDDRGRTATELADLTGVTRPTASSHLARLVDGGLLRVDRQGRHRYFRLAGSEVGRMLESLLVVAGVPEPSDERFGPDSSDMRQARMCYDHLAGALGVGIADGLIRRGALIEDGDDFRLTSDGESLLAGFGIDAEAARRKRRYFARTCLDWSERRPHLAGSLGAAIADRMFELGWIERGSEGRTVFITLSGRYGLADTFGVRLSAEPVPA